MCVCVCVCVCVSVFREFYNCVSECVCVCVREREREGGDRETKIEVIEMEIIFAQLYTFDH